MRAEADGERVESGKQNDALAAGSRLNESVQPSAVLLRSNPGHQ
jgi:hypothetical protein